MIYLIHHKDKGHQLRRNGNQVIFQYYFNSQVKINIHFSTQSSKNIRSQHRRFWDESYVVCTQLCRLFSKTYKNHQLMHFLHRSPVAVMQANMFFQCIWKMEIFDSITVAEEIEPPPPTLAATFIWPRVNKFFFSQGKTVGWGDWNGFPA